MLGPQKFNQYDEVAYDLVRLETKIVALDGIEGDWRASQDRERAAAALATVQSPLAG